MSITEQQSQLNQGETCGMRALCGWSPPSLPADTVTKQRVDRIRVGNLAAIGVVGSRGRPAQSGAAPAPSGVTGDPRGSGLAAGGGARSISGGVAMPTVSSPDRAGSPSGCAAHLRLGRLYWPALASATALRTSSAQDAGLVRGAK